jgi:hypothetical protein
MSYTATLSLALGAANSGLTLRGQLVDTAGTNSGGVISTGFVEIGDGSYLLTASIPDGFRGGLKVWDNASGTVLGTAALNPETLENQDVKTSTRLADADYTAPLSASDLWSHATRTLTDKTGFSLTAGEHTAITQDVTGGLTAFGYTAARALKLDYLDGAISSLPTAAQIVTALDSGSTDLDAILGYVDTIETTLTALQGAGWTNESLKAIYDRVGTRSSHTAADVWAAGTRSLTDKTGFALTAGEHTTIQADVTTGLTAQGYTSTRAGYLDTLNGLIAGVWSYATRTLTAFGFSLSVSSEDQEAIAEAVDTQLSSTHGAGAWTQDQVVGAYTVTVQVESETTGGPLAGVRVTLKDATDTTLLDQKYTDPSGVCQFTVDAATYKVHVGNVAGYESLAAQTLVVTGSQTATYALNPLAISTPADPALCVVYGHIYLNGDPVSGADVTAKLTSKGAIADEILLSVQTLTATTDADGYFELELVRSDQFDSGEGEYRVQIPTTGINQVVTIPNQASVNLADLLKPQL